MKSLAILLLAAAGAINAADFDRDIRPLLAAKCVGCHNEELRTAGLVLESRETALAGGGRGAAIVPGEPDGSLLLRAVRHEGELKMPPGGRLAEAEIQLLSDWIRGGAAWGSGPAAPRGRHWAFAPPVRPERPAVSNPGWNRTTVDEFILARLEREGIQPSPPASKRTLIRRAYLDVIGLPPTPEEVEAFVADERGRSLERGGRAAAGIAAFRRALGPPLA